MQINNFSKNSETTFTKQLGQNLFFNDLYAKLYDGTQKKLLKAEHQYTYV